MKKAIFLDRDGTINVEKDYIYKSEDLVFEEGTIEALKTFKNLEYILIVAMDLATYDELKEIYDITGKINNLLKEKFDNIGITLVDFKIEFGKNSKGEILLADEITPDTCRLWDKETGEKLDKDRFRRDLGNIEEAYIEVVKRLTEKK